MAQRELDTATAAAVQPTLSALRSMRRSARAKAARRRMGKVPVSVWAVDSGFSFQAEACDLSTGGVLLETKLWLPPGASLRVRFISHHRQPLFVNARVGRAIEGIGLTCFFVSNSRRVTKLLSRWLGRSGGLHAVAGTIVTPPPEPLSRRRSEPRVIFDPER